MSHSSPAANPFLARIDYVSLPTMTIPEIGEIKRGGVAEKNVRNSAWTSIYVADSVARVRTWWFITFWAHQPAAAHSLMNLKWPDR